MNTVSSLTKATNSAANSALNSMSLFATSTVPSALNSMGNFATKTVPNATVSALNSVSDFATETVPGALNSVVNAATTTINSAAPIANSLMPFSTNSGKTNTNKNANKNANVFTNVTNMNMNKNNSSNSSKSSMSGWTFPIMILLVIIAIATTLMVVFKDQMAVAYQNMVVSFRKAFGMDTTDITEAPLSSVTGPVTTPADTTHENDMASKSIVEKVLPFGTNEVFNVSTNDYSYYDAEPLCKALGAELATYDQVKTAWENGADWCNYGWSKGQVAVYPTQKSTWEKVQSGPEDERDACGQPGVNGGYFDNPEMRFGVNCYGNKPDQSSNDERVLMMNGSIPKTADALKIDKKVKEYKAMADKVGVLPFNNDKWESPV